MFVNQSDITAELQTRIDQVAAAGGGEISIPAGEYHVRPIQLKSHLCLHLQAGAKLIASPHQADYFPIGYHHNEMKEVYYMHSIVRNVLIENVIVKQSNRAFVSMCHPHTGLVENVRVANCILEGRSYGGNWWGNGEALVLMVTPHHISSYREPQPAPRFDTSIKNVAFSNLICRAERPIGIVASAPLIKNVQLKDITIEIVPEIRPSLKGNVIDLAPGPENYQIPHSGVGVLYKKAHLQIDQVTDPEGNGVEILDITE